MFVQHVNLRIYLNHIHTTIESYNIYIYINSLNASNTMTFVDSFSTYSLGGVISSVVQNGKTTTNPSWKVFTPISVFLQANGAAKERTFFAFSWSKLRMMSAIPEGLICYYSHVISHDCIFVWLNLVGF